MKRTNGTRRIPVRTPLIRTLARFFLASVLASVQLSGGFAPFALGFVAASGGGTAGLAALAGAVTGAALSMDFSHILRFSAVGILIFSASMSFAGTRLKEYPLFFPFVSSLLVLSVEAVYLITLHATLTEVAECFTYGAVTGLSAYYFPDAEGFLVWDTPERGRAHLFLLACFSAALSGVPLPLSLSLGRIGNGALLMSYAFVKGALPGAAAGLGIGLLTDLTLGGQSLYFTAAYGLSAFFLGFQRQTGKWLSAALYGLVLLFFLLPQSPWYRVSVAYEYLASALLFLMLPLRRQRASRVRKREPFTQEDRLRDRLRETATAFRELSMSFPPSDDGEENPSVLFDRTAERVCRGCPLLETCWQKDYQASYTAFNDAAGAMLRRGRAEAADFPPYFSNRCTHFPSFLSSLNEELPSFLQRKQYRTRLRAAHELAEGQYAELSELLESAAAEPSVAAMTATPLLYRLGAASRPKRGEAVSGDVMRSFESDDRRRLYLLLSDGMGTGEEAQREAATAVRLLEHFLKTGIPVETALRTLRGAMTLRSARGGAFTTVDLLSFDLATGDAALYKYGAAATYIREGRTVRRIRSRNLPVGLDGADAEPDVTQLSLTAGTILLLTSDGVSETEDERWLSELLCGTEEREPQALAELILRESVRHGGENDDCAVLVFTLPDERERV